MCCRVGLPGGGVPNPASHRSGRPDHVPNLDSIAPQLVILFGGRQSARTIHFLCAAALVTFLLVHVLMVLLSGVWNNMRSMTTGWYRIEDTEDADDGTA
jgi:Ni,Fe-hydrogenase I cytochrome b subunit